MKAIIPDFSHESDKPLYQQLYEYIRDGIIEKEIVTSEKLPSLRNLSESLGISLTTVELAYNQLLVEGYIYSRPHSGYYVGEMYWPDDGGISGAASEIKHNAYMSEMKPPALYCDPSSFDFNKWKKCMSNVLNDHRDLLLFESDTQGEESLRYEISKYVYSSRGVKCDPDQIVIAAGTQQITSHLARILQQMGISHVASEDPGYLPVINIFRDRGFTVTPVEVRSDGIDIGKLPVNIRSVAYVNPSNQFPTGAVMPAGRRYQLIDWASKNSSFIIEDDYDSELRYFGKPVPALQGLDRHGCVIYLGSFSSTLLQSIRLSYMVLPEDMAGVFNDISGGYDQTCSKAEQLTLALFMEAGYYRAGIRKLRQLYAKKLRATLDAFRKYSGIAEPINTESGLNLIVRVRTEKPMSVLSDEARSVGVVANPMVPVTSGPHKNSLIFYYSLIPLGSIEKAIGDMVQLWKS
jgi:Transcriptional regulators containing a DNA-binding HTH domain and an aminotransferase domain (MocR family) and their eukaryotic orthologs